MHTRKDQVRDVGKSMTFAFARIGEAGTGIIVSSRVRTCLAIVT